MKRLAVLLFLAAILEPSAGLTAGDWAPPLPTGMAAPTTPQVPAPVLVDGLPVAGGSDWSRTSFRDRLGVAPAHVEVADAKPTGPRVWTRMTSWMPFGKSAESCEPHDPLFAKPKWCEQCAPAVRHPLPQLPAGLSTDRTCTSGSSAAPSCAPAASGSCCQKLKEWLCFHQTPVRFPLIPTPRDPALYTYFPTQERAGACAGGGCATEGGATGRKGRGVGGCVPCPTAGEALLPGYRLANPEAPGTAELPTGSVTTTSYKAPLKR